MRASRFAIAIAIAVCVQFAIVVGFRAFIYAGMYIAPDAPYGISDVIEFVLGWILIAIGAVTAITALTLLIRGPRPNRIIGALLALLLLALAAALEPLHSAAAEWSSARERSKSPKADLLAGRQNEQSVGTLLPLPTQPQAGKSEA